MAPLLDRIRAEEKDAAKLPALKIADSLRKTLEENGIVVITAPPGAGKSTILPVCIYDILGSGTDKILMLEPRRLAAVQIAERISWLLGEQVGNSVGYQVRFENRTSAQTKIDILTEGILSRKIVGDPTLEGIKAVIFDEFHERSLNCDQALALVRETRNILRPDLKIIIMSATMDAGQICAALDAPLLECTGLSYPVTFEYDRQDATPASCAEDCARAVSRALREQSGDILVFLPGEGEIRRCASLMEGKLGSAQIRPLYGLLTPEQQRMAIAPSPEGERKVVLATPVAETSITIEGVRTVIDSGLCRRLVFDPRTSLGHLESVRISRDMADQRAGRAGRTAPGHCHRLYSEAAYRQMAPCRTPEILEADLCPLVLDTAVWGGGEVETLPWLTPPPHANVIKATSLLRELGAVGPEGRATAHGRRLETLPCHPRIAQMLLASGSDAQKALAADLAALLEEKDPLAQDGVGTDISLRVNALRDCRKGRNWQRIERVAAQYRRLAGAAEEKRCVGAEEAGELLAAAYPERIARATEEGCGNFLSASGEKLVMEMSDPLASAEWIVAASVNLNPGGKGRIFLAAPLERKCLESFACEQKCLKWDSRGGEIAARTETRIGRLVLGSKPLDKISVEDITEIICQAAAREGLSMFNFNDEVRDLQRRVATAAAWHPELELPDLSDDRLLERCREWLPMYIGKARTATELKKIELSSVIWNLLDYTQQQAVDRIAPTHIQVPTGSRIRLEYRQGAEVPVLRVRLQECFGMQDSPRVDSGTRAVLMELLSPGFKPVQLTADLKSFWNGTYFEVRKELRRRYPRHSWPDNPLEAEAIRGVKKNS